jgi:rhomboid protease GluP
MVPDNPSPRPPLNNTFDMSVQEWDLPCVIPAKPAGSDYGYIQTRQAIACTREYLIERVQNGAEFSFVWMPESPEPVPPEKAPFLLEAFRRNLRRSAWTAILIGAAIIAFAVMLAIVIHEWSMVYRNFLFVFGALSLVEGAWRFRRSYRYTQADAISDASAARFAAWLKTRALSGYTVMLIACMVVVGGVQFVVSNPIEVAGLVKPAVRNGEVWRLFTATLMHANFTHFWLNALALVHFSKIIEQTVQRALVPLVFLLTAPVGSVFSVLLYPNTTSIGASGGLMGLLGFITVAAYFDRNKYPQKYFRQMIEAIVSIGLFGLFGFAFIDNAGHFGGLAGGLLLGWLLFRRKDEFIRKKRKLIELGGMAALVVLGFIAAYAVYRMTR